MHLILKDILGNKVYHSHHSDVTILHFACVVSGQEFHAFAIRSTVFLLTAILSMIPAR